jgi:murein DD-endopeptidase MepM/ murein hydrolase activator NlpD
MKMQKVSMFFGIIMIAFVLAISAVGSASAAPAVPSNFFQWPWPQGQSWKITQGPHTKAENWSGLDMNQTSVPWGSGSVQEVRAAAGGKVTTASYCYVVIDHQNGWSTGYVHIRTMVKKGDTVVANQKIGIIDTNYSTAVCGGSTTAPHLHFRLMYNGNDTSIVGATFSGWTVSVQDGYYTDPVHKSSLYTKNGVTKHVGDLLDNIMTPPPAPTPIPVPHVFKNGTSLLYQDQNWGRANLRVCADNLNGQTVYVDFRRDGRVFTIAPQKATSNCITFWDMDGAGSMNKATTYYSRAALNQQPNTGWPIPCAGPSGGQGLCDALRRP